MADIGGDICCLPSVLQAKLNLLHDRVEEWFHITANGLCDVSNGDECFEKCGQNRGGGPRDQTHRTNAREIC